MLRRAPRAALARRLTAASLVPCAALPPAAAAPSTLRLHQRAHAASTAPPSSDGLGAHVAGLGPMDVFGGEGADAPQTRLRGRVERIRIKGKNIAFLLLRQPVVTSPPEPGDSSGSHLTAAFEAPGKHAGGATIQVVLNSPLLVSKAKDLLTPETVVDVAGVLVKAKVAAASADAVELRCYTMEVVSKADTPLPFPIDAPSANVPTVEGGAVAAGAQPTPPPPAAGGAAAHAHVVVKRETQLDHRPYDLRTRRSGTLLALPGIALHAFRGAMLGDGFTEIITPKLLPMPSEGGSSVFQVSYFKRHAYLAQSPQLYKQMVVQGDVPRVFEIGPVFRAENSNTHRHLTEFTGLDGEMVVGPDRHYKELLDVLEATVERIVTDLPTPAQVAERAGLPLATCEATNEPMTRCVVAVPTDHALFSSLGDDFAKKPGADPFGARLGGAPNPRDGNKPNRHLRITFDNAMRLLQHDGVLAKDSPPPEDFSIALERSLGQSVKVRYGVDVVTVDEYPTAVRPFYTMACPEDPERTRSYDVLVRGEEVCSGAQRVHDHVTLVEQALSKEVSLDPIRPYLDSFKYGAWPHAGFGIGLQRLVMLAVGLQDVRDVTFFPRDPKRIMP